MKKRMIFIIPMIVFVGILILFQTVFFIGYVPTASMEPTLKENSIVFGSRIFGDLSVGDIIVFKHDGRTMVKRIAAVGGEMFESDEKIYVVPNSCFFVLGDNAENSWDSRYWEDPFVNREQIVAKMIYPAK